jgi:pimeloyl-ACP methyl ester carboxylesterase
MFFQFFTHGIGLVLLIYVGICVIYFLLQERFIFVPTLPGEPFQSKLSTPVEEFMLDTAHGGKIHALLLKVEEPKALIFYLHGNTGSLKRWQFMAEELSSFGFDVFVPDYRGYGKSRGPRSESAMHNDMDECYEFAKSLGYAHIIVYGRSLGSGFATRLAARKKPLKLVLETPFHSFDDVARWYLPILPVKTLLRYHMRNDLEIQKLSCPIHIFHGTKDTVVPYKSALKLYRSIQDRGEVYMTTIPGGKHSNLNKYPLFHSKLERFLNQP